MVIRFNFEKFANNLGNISKSLLGTALFYESTKMARGMSLWGCGGGMYGGFSGMMGGCCTPPLNIFHPYYSQNQTSPYLLQQGQEQANAAARQMFDEALASIAKQNQASGQNSNSSGDITTAIKEGKEFKFVSDKWLENNAKFDQLSDAEKAAQGKEYGASLKKAGTSLLSEIENKYGNKDSKLSYDEFCSFLTKTELGENPSDAEKAQLLAKAKTAFERLDIDKNGEISQDEAIAIVYYLDSEGTDDVDGTLSSEAMTKFKTALTAETDNITTGLKASYDGLYGSEE